MWSRCAIVHSLGTDGNRQGVKCRINKGMLVFKVHDCLSLALSVCVFPSIRLSESLPLAGILRDPGGEQLPSAEGGAGEAEGDRGSEEEAAGAGSAAAGERRPGSADTQVHGWDALGCCDAVMGRQSSDGRVSGTGGVLLCSRRTSVGRRHGARARNRKGRSFDLSCDLIVTFIKIFYRRKLVCGGG